MRVSVRLKQSFWATALIVSMIVTQSPSLALGQSQFSTQGTAASANGEFTPPAQQSPVESDEASLAEARRALLKARQALAHSDVETAKAMLESAKRHDVDFQKIGDSPQTVQSMIDRQHLLEELRQRNEQQAFNSGAAAFLLTQSEALMYYHDFDTAEMLVKNAQKFPVEFNSTIGNPVELLKLIELARSAATKTAQKTEAIAQQPVNPTAVSPKAETLKYLSQAQLAIDQERWNEARFFVDKAKKLGVPDDQFGANEPRPWQLDLVIQNALNRQSFDPAVIQASFEEKANQVVRANQVVQANYDPAKDTSKTVAASAIDSDDLDFDTNTDESDKFNPIPKTAQGFYLSGLQALDNKDAEGARAYFEKAWNNRDQLDAQTLQSVQDQLTQLTTSRPQEPAGTQEAQTPQGGESVDGEGLASQASSTLELQDPRSPANPMFRVLQTEIFKERAAAERILQTNPREALEKMTMLRGRIAQSQLDPVSQRPLLTIIDRDLTEMQAYIDENLPQIINDETNADRREQVALRRQRRVDNSTQLQKLVEEFNTLIDEERFMEAQVVARQAADLAPNSDVVAILTEKATLLRRLDRMGRIKAAKEEGFWGAMANVERASAGFDDSDPLVINDPELWNKNSLERISKRDASQYNSEADRRIWNILRNQSVQGDYRGTLAEAVDQLSRQAGVNIVFDDLALAGENIQKDHLIDIPIREPISLRSALEVILNSAGLVFVVENEVIKVTSRDASQSKLETKTYYIGDLVMPVTAPQNPMQMHWMQPNMGARTESNGVMNVSYDSAGSASDMAMSQRLGRQGLIDGAIANAMYDGTGGTNMGQPTYGTVGAQPLGGVTLADFQPLIDLIQNTIQPDTWLDTGQGLGTIQAFLPNLTLIVSQTQAIQDEIQDLLKKLRELNDVQIVVEVRFVSLRDEFFERVGIDFDFSINDNSQLVDPNADVITGPSAIIGRAPADTVDFTPTNDLDLKFVQSSFSAAEPIFGGFQAAEAANFGFAILSDIEVFFLIQAAKGDTRTNITQAPTVTMFNGQSASVTDGAQRPFVTSVVPVVGDFAVAHQPIITILPDGTNLNVTAVVSDDRRFVRLQLVPFFTQVTDVDTFTFDGSTSTEQSSSSTVLDNLLDAVDGGTRTQEEDVERVTTQGITVQLPVLSTTSINTVVSVPDGGTVLMGGIKRMNESRTERGVPFLSNVPYVNRLFKNVGIGHETQNLMMMVTPRIIIQDEIEEDTVGLTPTN